MPSIVARLAAAAATLLAVTHATVVSIGGVPLRAPPWVPGATLQQTDGGTSSSTRLDRQPQPASIPPIHRVLRSDWIDVRSTGAVGDGIADDSDALEAAFRKLTHTGELCTAPSLIRVFMQKKKTRSRVT